MLEAVLVASTDANDPGTEAAVEHPWTSDAYLERESGFG
jgi:hypothetical protein